MLVVTMQRRCGSCVRWLIKATLARRTSSASISAYFVGQDVLYRAEAIKLYCLAAEQGNAHAQDSLGFAYLDGVEVTRLRPSRDVVQQGCRSRQYRRAVESRNDG